jgi:hypothetical protein
LQDAIVLLVRSWFRRRSDPKGAGMLQVKNLPLANRNLQIVRGYVAFNARDWPTLQQLLCENVIWHPMDGGPAIIGRDGPLVHDAQGRPISGVIAYLQDLRARPTEAELFGISTDVTGSISLDFTTTGPPEGDHACADKILFDDSGCIREVWHCAAATHQHGHAGHPAIPGAPHPHP